MAATMSPSVWGAAVGLPEGRFDVLGRFLERFDTRCTYGRCVGHSFVSFPA